MKFKIALVGLISLLILAGCSKDDKKSGPSNPASATGTTNANGTAALTVGSYTVNATVVDASQTGLAGIELTGYLGHENVVLVAVDPTGARYPSITGTAVSSSKMGAPGHIQSPDEIAGTALEATITMYPIQVGVYGFTPDPTGVDAFIADAWTTETYYNGPLSDLYNMRDTINTYVFMHLSTSVATAMGATIRTAVFTPTGTVNFATFASLVGLTFHIFEGDTLHYAQITYNNALLPMFYIDNVVAHRDFWAQFTLIWGETPYDLDSHLWTPLMGTDSTRYHIYYGDPGYRSQAPYADLDVDDTDSFGPEHLTIYENFPGTYVYSVRDYQDDDGLISGSHAVVSLLKPDGSIQIFAVPTDSTGVAERYYWNVCSINGTTGVVTVINTVTANPPYPDQLAGEPSKPVNTNKQ